MPSVCVAARAATGESQAPPRRSTGCSTGLTDVFGVGAFTPGGGRFHTFLRDYRALLPTASAFADAWDELARQAFVGVAEPGRSISRAGTLAPAAAPAPSFSAT